MKFQASEGLNQTQKQMIQTKNIEKFSFTQKKLVTRENWDKLKFESSAFAFDFNPSEAWNLEGLKFQNKQTQKQMIQTFEY